ncbi:hypothetical protein [Flavobacterium sp. U410]
MKGFDLSNSKLKGLTPLDLYRNENIKAFRAGGILTERLIPMYQELLRLAIGDEVSKNFYDKPLTKQQTEKIQSIFEEQIDKTLPVYEDYKGTKIPHKRLEWKGKVYELHLGLNSPNNRKIDDFHKIVTIAEECLKENKPMYLSIE